MPDQLTDAERERFAAWCEEDAAATLGLLEQMAKLPGAGIEIVARLKRTEAIAQEIVAKILHSVEAM